VDLGWWWVCLSLRHLYCYHSLHNETVWGLVKYSGIPI
jgi:hypothetical protein